MSFFKYLLFSLLLCCFGLHTSATIPIDCNALSVTYEVKTESNNKFGIAVTVKGAVSSLEYLFYSSEGSILNRDLTKNSIQRVNKGKYFCIVRDGKSCRKTIEIEIK